MNNNSVGNLLCFYIGGIALSITIFKCIKQTPERITKVFSFIGKNTDICMAFNFASVSYWRIVAVDYLERTIIENCFVQSVVIIAVCYLIAGFKVLIVGWIQKHA